MRCSVVGSSGVVARAGVIVRVLVVLLGLVVLAGCQPEPAFVPTPSPSLTGTPAVNQLPENADEDDYYTVAVASYEELHLLVFAMEQSGDYSNPPAEIDELVTAEYRQTMQRVHDITAEQNYLFEGEFTHRDIRTRTAPGEIPEDSDYALEACRDYTKVAIYDGAGNYLLQGPIRHDITQFQIQDGRMIIIGGTTEKVDQCPF